MEKNRVLFINPIRIRPVVGPIAFDYLGYALVSPDKQPVLERYADGEIDITQMIGELEEQ